MTKEQFKKGQVLLEEIGKRNKWILERKDEIQKVKKSNDVDNVFLNITDSQGVWVLSLNYLMKDDLIGLIEKEISETKDSLLKKEKELEEL